MMRIHFIAVGGAAMHSLALALHLKGHQVTGSDDAIADPSRSRLREAGLLPAELGWHPARVHPGLDAVILGMHAKADNPELARARELGIRIWSFPEFLHHETRGKRRAVVGGSHGKTTVTAMVMHALREAGIPFDYMVGAELPGFRAMVGLEPDSPLAVFEGDEYPASPIDPRPKFHLYHPHVAVINGVSWDHANVFPTPEVYQEQFRSFAASLEAGGVLIYNREDPGACDAVERAGGQVRRVPFETPVYRIEQGRYRVSLPGGETEVRVLGRHNMRNLAAAAAMAKELGVPDRRFVEAAATYPGAARRLQRLSAEGRTPVFLDFAHAPSKVQATVEGVREAFPEVPLAVVLELHTFSSVRREFIPNYRGSLDAADQAAIFLAPETCRQKGVDPLDGDELRAAFGRGDLIHLASRKELETHLMGLGASGETVLLMSSGHFAGADIRALLGC